MTDRRLIARLFDNEKPLVSARYQTVNGIELAPGDEIAADLDRGMRMKLWLSRRALYADAFRPTPVAEAASEDEATEGEGDWMVRAHGVEITAPEAEGGNYLIKADWLDEAEAVRGEEAAKARAAELRAEAQAKEGEGEQDEAPASEGEQDGSPEGAEGAEGEAEGAGDSDPTAEVNDADGNPLNPPAGDPNDPPSEIAEDARVTVEETGGGWYAVKAPWMAEPEKVRGEEAANKRAAEIAAEGPPPPVE